MKSRAIFCEFNFGNEDIFTVTRTFFTIALPSDRDDITSSVYTTCKLLTTTIVLIPKGRANCLDTKSHLINWLAVDAHLYRTSIPHIYGTSMTKYRVLLPASERTNVDGLLVSSRLISDDQPRRCFCISG